MADKQKETEEKQELISLQTRDRNFDELLLQEYPGKIFQRNRMVVKDGKKRNYHYFGLEKNTFQKFIASQPDIYEYQVKPFLGCPEEVDGLRGVNLN